MTATVWNGAQKSTVAVRSVLIYHQRSTAREALTHAITAALSSVIHIGWVADASDLSTAFAGNPADLASAHRTARRDRRHRRRGGRVPAALSVRAGHRLRHGRRHTVLAAAVSRGARGLMLWPPWYGRTPVRGLSIGARLGAPSAPGLTLTQRTVLQGMSQGRSNRDIAETLGISEDTVRSHAASLYRKLGARDRAHAVALGLRKRLVS